MLTEDFKLVVEFPCDRIRYTTRVCAFTCTLHVQFNSLNDINDSVRPMTAKIIGAFRRRTENLLSLLPHRMI